MAFLPRSIMLLPPMDTMFTSGSMAMTACLSEAAITVLSMRLSRIKLLRICIRRPAAPLMIPVKTCSCATLRSNLRAADALPVSRRGALFFLGSRRVPHDSLEGFPDIFRGPVGEGDASTGSVWNDVAQEAGAYGNGGAIQEREFQEHEGRFGAAGESSAKF